MSTVIQKINKFITNPQIRFSYLNVLGFYSRTPDDVFLKKAFRVNMHQELNLDNPQTFNEKLQWLKLYNRKPEYTMMVDKYKVREYVANTLGEEYLIPLLGVWDDPDEIDFDALPNQFVLKCNHNSGLGMCICKDKSKLNIEKVKKELKKGLKQDYYLTGREWPYKDVPRKIVCEKFMTNDEVGGELEDYKLMCFQGKVKASFVCNNRFSKDGLNVTFYDTDWKRMPFERHYPASKTEITRPASYDEMVQLAEKLAQNIPFVRVDFYEIKGKPYFGELTFFPGSGFEEFNPEQADKELGSWIKLPVGGVYNL